MSVKPSRSTDNYAFTYSDCGFDRDPASELLFGPAFSDSVHMTIEACVEFCDAQGSRLAGLKGSGCGERLSCFSLYRPAKILMSRLRQHLESRGLLRKQYRLCMHGPRPGWAGMSRESTRVMWFRQCSSWFFSRQPLLEANVYAVQLLGA